MAKHIVWGIIPDEDERPTIQFGYDTDTKQAFLQLNDSVISATNLENGEGAGSLKQKGTVTIGGYSGNVKTQALGPASVALNGLYKPGQGLTPDSQGVIAAGPGSFAGGKDTTAYQACSFAFGGGNKAGLTEAEFNAKYPSGKDAHGKTYTESYSFATAEGVTTKATGYASHAENEGTIASGHRSHASGQETEATGNRSFAAGYKSHATNTNDFAIGEETVASGYNSFAQGFKSQATEYAATALGENTEAKGKGSLASGFYSQANGDYSVALGYGCIAGGDQSIALGRNNKTTVDYQFVCGTYCTENTPDALLVVGNGTANTTKDRSNAFEVLKDGRAKVFKAPQGDNDIVRWQEYQKLITAIEALGGSVA